jgi:hypothetical protein
MQKLWRSRATSHRQVESLSVAPSSSNKRGKTGMADKKHIRGRDAARMADENDKRRPITLEPAPNGSVAAASESHVPVEINAHSRTPPPRVLKPSRGNDQVLAPTPDLEGHRAALRRVFGTLSEEYSQTMFGKLVATLRPNPFEHLDEAKRPLESPRGPPEPFAPPCIRHRLRPLTAAWRQG